MKILLLLAFQELKRKETEETVQLLELKIVNLKNQKEGVWKCQAQKIHDKWFVPVHKI